jgi:saccharopine dehydrogenase-like NADP-dependent oxidoreductase
MKVLLLGVGMQGKAALYDLLESGEVAEVIAADRDVAALKAHVEEKRYGDRVLCEYVDAEKPESIHRLMKQGSDVVIDLLPSVFCGDVAAAAVNHGVHLVNAFYAGAEVKNLADQAEARNVTILPEFGMDPGIDLVLLGEAVRSMEGIEEIISYGAGFPEPMAANNPIKYKVTWTFEGVLKSYRRPGRVIRRGKVVEIKGSEMFSGQNIHEIEIEGLGRLEAFPNGDALKYADLLGIERSGLRDLGRYSLRWPGHCAFWKTMVDLHLLDGEPVMVDGAAVDRRRFLAAALEPHIQLGDHERDVVVVRIEVVGRKDEHKTRAVYQVIDRRDLETGFTAMARTVGYTASIGALLIGTGKIARRGVLSPVKDIPYELFVAELGKRNIKVTSELANCQ